LAEEIEKVILAYQRAQLTPSGQLQAFRASIGADRYDSAHLPTGYPMIAPASAAARKLWLAGTSAGDDPSAGEHATGRPSPSAPPSAPLRAPLPVHSPRRPTSSPSPTSELTCPPAANFPHSERPSALPATTVPICPPATR